jgi:ankyrin repeat protein
MMEALEEEPWAIDQPDRYGMAPIHYASMDGDLEILKMLIWAEADVNICDLDGLTPLMFAALNGHVDCIRLLVDSKCNIEQKSHTEFRAIHYAAQFCQPRSVLALVAAGASASARGWLGQTPLHRLARCEMDTSFEAIKETILSLLVSKGVSIDARDSNGATPIFRAVAKGNLPVLRCLVEAGASLLPVNDGSRNILHMVTMYPDNGIVQYLSSLDSEVFLGINAEHRDAGGRTPMDHVPSSHGPGATRCPQGMAECGSLRQDIQKLYCLIRHANLRHRSEQLRTIIRLVGQKQTSCARLQLAHVINEKKEWGQLELASWYRGIDQMIQALEYDKVIIALEDDVQQLTAQIGTIGAAGTNNEGGVSDIFN